MNTGKLYTFFIMIFLFYVNTLFSDSTENMAETKSIYFCTRDLDNIISQPGVEKENVDNNYIKVIPNIENTKNNLLRHCFMMLASQTALKDDHEYLIVDAAIGFFGHQNFPKKAFRMYEPLMGQVISCTPVRVVNKDENEDTLWERVMEFYNDEVKKGYENFSHNCCTVAYNSISAVGGDNSAIDPRSFNFGVGIRWKFEDSGSSYGLLKSVGIVSDQMLYMAESASPSSQRSEDDKEKDEL